MIILVCGDRNWTDRELVRLTLKQFDSPTIVHGAAKGADSLANEVAIELGFTLCGHPARWEKYGRAAGPIRNKEMLDHHPDLDFVIAFHDDLPNSKGTRNMLEQATERGIPWHQVSH